MRSPSTRLRNLLLKTVARIPTTRRLRARAWLLSLDGNSFEKEWRALDKLGPNQGVALDVGANRGLYSWRLAKLYQRVIAFEPNREVSSELAQSGIPNLELRNVALSSQSGQQNLYIPSNERGEELDGWASLSPENFEFACSKRSITITMMTLDEIDLPRVDFIKVDVEGHEVDFLAGAKRTLEKFKPNVLMEVRPETFDDVTRSFRELGMTDLRLSSCLGTDATPGMYLFGADPRGATD